MKKLYLLVALFYCLISAGISQNSIPNSDFEIWVDDNHPQAWNGIFIDLLFTQLYTLSKSTDAQSGSFAAQVETIDATLIAIPGIASLSEINFDLMGGGLSFATAGTPINVRPTNISGSFKYLPINGDTAMIAVVLTKWNTGTNQRDTLGFFGTMMNTAYLNYTPFNINISLSQTPDSMNILFVSSAGYSPQIGSALIVDNLSMDFLPNTGVETIVPFVPSLFPNPASENIVFSVPEEGISTVYIIDLTGKLVFEAKTTDTSFSVDVSSLPSGIYHVNIINNGNSYSHKFNILR